MGANMPADAAWASNETCCVPSVAGRDSLMSPKSRHPYTHIHTLTAASWMTPAVACL
jgi:hypothetical protein